MTAVILGFVAAVITFATVGSWYDENYGFDGSAGAAFAAAFIAFLVVVIVVLVIQEFGTKKSPVNESEKTEQEEAERRAAERRAAERAAQETERAKLQEERVAYYMQSPAVDRIVQEISARGTPFKIVIDATSVTAHITGGVITHIFLEHGEADFEEYLSYQEESGDAYMMGCAINRKLGDIYTVRDCVECRPSSIGDHYYTIWKHVELRRPLKKI